MKRALYFILALLLLLAACNEANNEDALAIVDEPGVVTVFKSPTWGCCGDWSEHLRENGFTVVEKGVNDLYAVKNSYQVPEQLHSCHTAVVDGYIIEGHVPAAEISRLLSEKPDIAGLGVAGMPIGSPGMEVEGRPAEAYSVLSFNSAGETAVYAAYP